MTEYETVERVIRYLDERMQDQPDLEELARVAGLSVSRFHRLFASWAGVTPKAFLKCLTFERAKDTLKAGGDILQASYEAGLSGPGRLHDLCVNLEAASPGEIKSGGEGWEIFAGYADSPFGRCLVADSPRGLCHLSFADEWDRLDSKWPRANITRDDARAVRCSERVFRPSGTSRPLKLFVSGSDFQVLVWRALLRVPEGRLVSYGRLAEYLGNPKASRAVGAAVGSNPIGYLIPCHRVIRETGLMGGYRWGTERKRAIQAWEGARHR